MPLGLIIVTPKIRVKTHALFCDPVGDLEGPELLGILHLTEHLHLFGPSATRHILILLSTG
jgi:hypothetical protein